MSPNLRAFLDMIAWSEIGPALLAKSDNGYNVIVGSTPEHPILFSDYSHHPKLHSDRCNSDAAGRYQFMGRYWEFYRDQLHLPDFGKDSQDRWATQLIRECHALDDIEAGHVFVAIAKCASGKRWASFEGANCGQHENSAVSLADAYRRAGGLSS
jgi:muramidase (phage lysozyme)